MHRSSACFAPARGCSSYPLANSSTASSASSLMSGALSKGRTSRSVTIGPGNVQTLGIWCAEAGIDFEVVDLAIIDGQLISSSLIRQCMREGNVIPAQDTWAGPIEFAATVAKEQAAGRRLGFPTINLAGIDTLVPEEGVYAGLAWIGRPKSIRGPRHATSGRTRRSTTTPRKSKPT